MCLITDSKFVPVRKGLHLKRSTDDYPQLLVCSWTSTVAINRYRGLMSALNIASSSKTSESCKNVNRLQVPSDTRLSCRLQIAFVKWHSLLELFDLRHLEDCYCPTLLCMLVCVYDVHYFGCLMLMSHKH